MTPIFFQFSLNLLFKRSLVFLSGSSPRLLPSPRPGLRLFGLGRFVSLISIHWAFFLIPTPCCKKEPSFGSLGGVWTSDSPSLARGAIIPAVSAHLKVPLLLAGSFLSSLLRSPSLHFPRSFLGTFVIGVHVRGRSCTRRERHPFIDSQGYSIVCPELRGLWILAGLCPLALLGSLLVLTFISLALAYKRSRH